MKINHHSKNGASHKVRVREHARLPLRIQSARGDLSLEDAHTHAIESTPAQPNRYSALFRSRNNNDDDDEDNVNEVPRKEGGKLRNKASKKSLGAYFDGDNFKFTDHIKTEAVQYKKLIENGHSNAGIGCMMKDQRDMTFQEIARHIAKLRTECGCKMLTANRQCQKSKKLVEAVAEEWFKREYYVDYEPRK